MGDAKTSRARKRRKSKSKGYVVAAGAGGAAGFALTKLLAGKQAVDTVAAMLASQITAATYGPVIAVGLASAAGIVCAIAIPLATIYALGQSSNRNLETKGEHHEKE